jgi:hypothetical protein
MIAKRLGQIQVREHMVISAYGFILLFISNQGIFLANYNYLPYGLATVSYVGLSSFLVLIKTYSAAISVGQNIELRNLIRKTALGEAGLLHNIRSAQMTKTLRIML